MPNYKKIRASVFFALLSIACCIPSFVFAQQSPSVSPVSSIIVQQRAGISGDSDNDSIPDIIDVDDDNDTIPDDLEGTGDWDGDGVPDCLDVDSDNDGITDLYEAIAGSGLMLLLDADRDGKLDDSVVVGENGLADIVEQPAESGTSQTGTADLDGDGIRDHQDLDADNDGIPDVVEAGSSDAKFNGLYDFFLDLNSDGLADRLWTSPIVPRDSDQDGVEDFRDLDSDADGLTDRLETAGEDTDGDGKVDNFVDANIDGLNDEYESLAMVLPDTDSDSFPDYRDIDSDGDGVTDTEEAFGGNVQSTLINSTTPFKPLSVGQNEEITLKTGENGSVFGCTLSYDENTMRPADPIFLLLLGASIVSLLRRRTWLVTSVSDRSGWWAVALPAFALLTGCATQQLSDPAHSTNARQPYAGIGIGPSLLKVDTSNIPLDQDKSRSVAAQITLGLSMSERLSAEARVADLGEATFNNGGSVGYQVADVSALYKRRSSNLTGFARLGLGALFNDGSVRTTQKNKMHVLVGFGGEYAINPQVALRAEWQGHDVDVIHSQISMLYRFGVPTKRPAVVIAVERDKNTGEELNVADADFNTIPDNPKSDQPTATAPKPAKSKSEPTEPKPAKPIQPVLATPTPSLLLDVPDGASENKGALVIGEIEKPSPASKSYEELALLTPQTESTNSAAKELLVMVPIPPENIPAKELLAIEPIPAKNTSTKELLAVAPIPTKNSSAEELLAIAPTPTKNTSTPVGVVQDDIVDAADNCLGTNNGSLVFSDRCAMFADSVPGLTFFPDTDQLTNSAEEVLDTLVETLKDVSDIRVTVAVHTGASSDPNAAMFLTRRRTITIIRYLSDRGIDSTRLRPEAYGDTQPLASATRPSDNDRVVLSSR